MEKNIDLRIKKTLLNIKNAFIEIANTKPINSITVKEICEKAMINKTTFYSHYENIIDLIEALENEAINELFLNINFVPLFVANPEKFIYKIIELYENNVLASIFMNSEHKLIFLEKIYTLIKELVYKDFPQLKEVKEFDITLSFIHYGIIGVLSAFNHEDKDKLATTLGNTLSSVYNSIDLKNNIFK